MAEKNSNIEKVARSAVFLSIGSIITVILSFVKESVFAFCFGTSAEADAYSTAGELPVTLLSFISVAISTVLIPINAKIRANKGEEKAKEFLNELITFVFLFSLVFVILLEIFAPVVIRIVAPGFDDYTTNLAAKIIRFVLLTTSLSLLIKIFTGISNIYDRFFLVSLHPNIFSLSVIAFSLLFYRSLGIAAPVLGLLVGKSIEFLYTVFLIRKKYRYRPSFHFGSEGMRASYKLCLPVFVGIAVDELNKLADKFFVSFFQTGSVASLHYAARLSSGISTLFVTALNTAIYPELSRKAAGGDNKATAKIYSFAIQVYMLLLIPIIVGGTFLGSDIVSLVFGHGAFSSESVATTAPLFTLYLSCLLFTSIMYVSANMFYASGNSKKPMINTSISVAINIILDLIFIELIDSPVALPLATLIATSIVCFKTLHDIKKINPEVSYRRNLQSLGKIAVGAGAMLVVLFAVRFVFVRLIGIHGTVLSILYMAISLVLGVVVYFGIEKLLKVEEVDFAVQKIGTLFKKFLKSKKHTSQEPEDNA